LAAALSEENFESFIFTAQGFEAYVAKHAFAPASLENLREQFPNIEFSYSQEEIKKENWNEEWEKNFKPVEVENYCRIRASFHTPSPAPAMDILIEPKMSFGTGHHQTTWLMARELFKIPISKTVLDVGCGTGVLAINCKKLGSQQVSGIDIDEWSIENSRENRKANGFSKEDIDFYQGTINSLDKSDRFDLILANINKNILMKEMGQYAGHLNFGGRLLLSGFFEADSEGLISEAKKHGLKNPRIQTKNEWALIALEK
jgi:ribosomal protein L11 methyltransferase